jgi:superfamily II DNA helicase RecQ
VFLTASLPPSQYDRFIGFCQLHKEETRLIRATTNRLRMRYEVRVVGKFSQPETELVDEINGIAWHGGRKGIVFTPGTKQAEVVSNRLGSLCSTAYHSKLAGKEENLQSWIDRKVDIIVATSGLGVGVNVQDVSDVFHLGRPYKLSDFVQQSGRAGRAGEDVRSVIFITQRAKEALEKRLRDGGLTHDEAAMVEMIVPDGCRRLIISRFMGGKYNEIDCSLDGAVPCDHCDGSQDNMVPC